MVDVAHASLTGADLHINKIHASTHLTGGTDSIPLDDLAAPADNTDLNASAGAHGLLPKLSANAAEFINGVGAWAIPGGTPPGAMVMWFTATPPTGWLECNGASLDRAVYAALFGVLGTKYGFADGAHFNLPDMRGYFPRGWSNGSGIDPDAATRTDRGDGTVGDNVGTKQVDEYESHTHNGYGTNNFTDSGTHYPIIADKTSGPTAMNAGSKTGGNETRPLNINVMFIIKT